MKTHSHSLLSINVRYNLILQVQLDLETVPTHTVTHKEAETQRKWKTLKNRMLCPCRMLDLSFHFLKIKHKVAFPYF